MADTERTETLIENRDKKYPIECYANRELSWLKFNKRVLEEANDLANPLCERLTFLHIYQTNLDEFFMVRVGALYDQRKTPIKDNKTRLTAKEQLSAVLPEVRRLGKSAGKTYKALIKQLKVFGVSVDRFAEISSRGKRELERYFISDVFPLLSPQIIAQKQPFPFLNNKQIYAVVLLREAEREQLGIIPCGNPLLPRLVQVPGSEGHYVLMEDLILSFSAKVFEHYRVESMVLVRIVRNADISIDDFNTDTEGRKKDYRRAMEQMIQTRKKLSPIKMDYLGDADASVVNLLCRYLDLPRKHAFWTDTPLDYSFFTDICDRLAPFRDLFFRRRLPQPSPAVREDLTVTEQLRKKDLLLHYPYQSMRPFLRLLQEASEDPEVVSIKITIYRLAQNSQVADILARAAENGKEVIALVELRARFDEENNVEHSKDLERAGCRIIYGIDNIKIHSKLCLITRVHNGRVEYTTQVGTGNYNEKTAKLYTDFSLMTADQSIGAEAAEIFNCLALGKLVERTDHLLVSPKCLQDRVMDKLDEQIRIAKGGGDARADFKLNSLTDKLLIDKLIEASRAGVKIRMLIRGICCLVPGIPGFTDNITVYSIVGRFLEHSRLYIFGAPGTEEVYISSADLMTRNTTRRVEVAAPIYDAGLRQRLIGIF